MINVTIEELGKILGNGKPKIGKKCGEIRKIKFFSEKIKKLKNKVFLGFFDVIDLQRIATLPKAVKCL